MELVVHARMSKLAKRMNAGYAEGSAYRGRALACHDAAEGVAANRSRPKKILSVIDKLGQEWPVYLHAEVYSVELNQSRHAGRGAAVEFTMGLVKLASPQRTLRKEGGALGKECYAHYNLKLNPMRVKLPTPFEGPLQGEGAPDLFVDVTVGGKRIGYCRVPTKHLMPVKECHAPMKDPDSTETWKVQGWFQLHADAIGGTSGESRTRRARQAGWPRFASHDAAGIAQREEGRENDVPRRKSRRWRTKPRRRGARTRATARRRTPRRRPG